MGVQLNFNENRDEQNCGLRAKRVVSFNSSNDNCLDCRSVQAKLTCCYGRPTADFFNLVPFCSTRV